MIEKPIHQPNIRPTVRRPTPPALADVALIDGPSIAAAACMSLSVFHEYVKAGKAPQPVIKQHRCTRWRLSDVRQWLIERASAAGADPAAAVTSRTKKAGAAAQAKRAATAAQ